MKLLLLPGMDGTGLLFEPFLEHLPDWLDPTIVAYPPTEPLGYEELFPLVRDACPPAADFVVLAESFSGPLALKLAATAPAGLRGVILCASFIRCPLISPLQQIAASCQPFMLQFIPTWFASRRALGEHESAHLRQLFETAITTADPNALAARVRAIANVDATAELRLCKVPLLYLSGQLDQVVGPECLREIQRAKPDTKVVELPAPHLVLQTFPEDAANVIGQFIKDAVGNQI